VHPLTLELVGATRCPETASIGVGASAISGVYASNANTYRDRGGISNRTASQSRL